jgi:putative hydrolase of the HAD superfamily
MPRIDAVVFDYGQTLLDFHRTEDALLDAYGRIRSLVVDTVAHDDVPAPAELVEVVASAVDRIVRASYDEERIQELDLVGLFDDALHAIGLELSPDAVRTIVSLDHAAYTSSLVLPDDTVAVLTALRDRGVRVGLVSNAHLLGDLMRSDLEMLGLAPLLDAGVFSSELGHRKPDPLIFRHVVDRLGADPAATLMVGDRVRDDIRGARAAGLGGALLTHQYRAEEPDGTETAVITHLGDVLDIVERW